MALQSVTGRYSLLLIVADRYSPLLIVTAVSIGMLPVARWPEGGD